MITLENIAEELHKTARKTFPRRKIIFLFKDDLWQADLFDIQSYSEYNRGFKFILIVIVYIILIVIHYVIFHESSFNLIILYIELNYTQEYKLSSLLILNSSQINFVKL